MDRLELIRRTHAALLVKKQLEERRAQKRIKRTPEERRAKYNATMGSKDERIRKRISRQDNGCWIWTGRMEHGSPVYNMSDNGKTGRVQIRRYLGGDLFKNAYRTTTSCGNPKCVSPEHAVFVCGRRSSLTIDKVRYIKYLITLELGNKDIGHIVDTPPNTVASIRAGRSWAKVEAMDITAAEPPATTQAVDFIPTSDILQPCASI
jgi:hypothetical protein